MKRLLLTAFIVMAVLSTSGQSYRRIREYVEMDYSRTSGITVSNNLAFDYRNDRGFSFTGGYHFGIHKHFLNLAYQIALFEDSHNRVLFIENRYLYRFFSAYKLQEFNAMLSLGWHTSHWDLKLGLCNRYIAEVPLRINGSESVIFEPMNVVFDVEYNLFTQDHNWNIGAGISNYREFIIERVTLFYYDLHGYYDINNQWRLTAEAGLHPCGVLNLSAQYNGFFCNLGFIYHIN